MMIPRDLPKAGQLVAAIVTDTALPETDREMLSHFSIGQDVLWQDREHARDYLYTVTRCVRFLDTSLAHLVEERRQPLLLAVLEYALGWLLVDENRLDVCGKIENEGGKSYQVHIMSVAEPAVVREATLATKFTMVPQYADGTPAVTASRTGDGTCLVLQDKHFARAEALAVVVVAVLASLAGSGKVIAVAALARLFSASQEALFRTRI
jgi:hypothetical protein